MDLSRTIGISELLDREKIRDCQARYARAVDRRDEALFRSVYWPDALEEHGVFDGTADDFINWVLPHLCAMDMTHHHLGQMLIQLDGDGAVAETYFQAVHWISGPDGHQTLVVWGRYVDNFERRNGEWRASFKRALFDGFINQEGKQGGWGTYPGSLPDSCLGRSSLEDQSEKIFAGCR